MGRKMDKILLIQNKHWLGKSYVGLIERNILNSLYKKLKLKEIQVILGIRRCGKSTIFKLLINHLMKKENPKSILYVNLDDPFFSDIWNDAKQIYKLLETSEKITGCKVKYLFLDEIQNISGWENFIKSLYDSETIKKIFITGSNSSLLKGQYAHLLSGRHIINQVFPLSFIEILNHFNINSRLDILANRANFIKLQEEYLVYGAFPEVFKTKDYELKRELLISYYDSILLKDCISNNSVRDIHTFKALSYYLISNISSLYSYNSLAKSIESNENTVKDFVNILNESFLFKEIKNFSFSLKEQTKAKKKIYCMDNGLIEAVSFAFSENKGQLFENMVFTEFLKNGLDHIYYYKNQKECDFILEINKTFIAIQVSYQINQQNRKREIDGLEAAMEKLGITKGYIISFDLEEKINENIAIIPFHGIKDILV